MLSGETPFKGDIHQVMVQHVNVTAPNLKEKCPKLSKTITDLVMSALSKKVENRPVSAIALSIALKAALEGEAPILSQAVDLFRSNFVKIFRVSTLINLPIILFNAILIGLLQQNPTVLPGFKYFSVLWWLLPLLITLFATKLNIAAFAPLISEIYKNKTIDISIKEMLVNLKRNLLKLVITTGHESLAVFSNLIKFIVPGFRKHIELLMSSYVVAIEKLDGKLALERSSKLIKPVRSLTLSIELRRLTTCFTIFFLSFLPFCLDELIDFSQPNSSSIRMFFFIRIDIIQFYAIAFVWAVLIPGLIAILIQPVIALAFLQIYIKSRYILGEPINNISTLAKTETYMPKYPLRKNRSKLVLASLIIVTLLLSSISYTLFVSPPEIVEVKLPEIEKIPDSENAWVEYRLALGELVKTSLLDSVAVSDFSLEDFDLKNFLAHPKLFQVLSKNYEDFYNQITNASKLTEQQKNVLDNYKTAITYLLAATKKPKAKYYSEINGDIENINLRSLMCLACITLAQSHRLILEGKEQEAINIILAVYKLSTDIMSEPYVPSVNYLIGNMVQGRTIKVLLLWLNNNIITQEDYLKLIKKMELLEANTISPTEIVLNSSLDFEREMRRYLVNYKFGENLSYPLYRLRELKPFYGLRLRIYHFLTKSYKNNIKNLSYEIKKYNFVKIKHQSENLEKQFYYPPTLEKLIAKEVFQYSSTFYNYASLRTFYMFQSVTSVWKSFAVCLAYKKANGHFPSSLEEAFANTGISIPIDPVTSKPIRYRLEKGVPVVWFAGYDGVDDEGKISSDYNNYGRNLSGQDWIFRFGEMPFLYAPTKK
ncbi:MAG: hypothetical protein HY819_16925 [Acidobacteria bacterium]|nr:hypothetical protein [Acidobacteriota bacterium]